MSERITPLTIPKHTVRYITERSYCNIVVLHYVCENTFVIPCTYNLEHAWPLYFEWTIVSVECL